jgi:hypothetical protein
MTRKRPGLRSTVGFTVFFAAVATALFVVPSAFAVSGAAFTTDNPGFAELSPAYVDQACTNGGPHTTPGVDCNNYLDKRDVWLNGGPSGGQNHLSDGTYFFAVLVPGGQHDPNDGSLKNLSSPNDDYTNRTFTVSGGHADTYAGTHLSDNTYLSTLGRLIQLMPYNDTTNPGGVYILAVCQLPDTPSPATGSGAPGVDPSSCKYDAFRVPNATTCTENCEPNPAGDLTGSKTATPAFTREFNWTIAKSVDACAVVNNTGGCNVTGPTKTLNYTVTVTKDAGTDSGWQVGGNITVTNGNAGDAFDVEVSDAIDNGGSCTVSDGTLDLITFDLSPTGATLPAGDTAIYPYSCTFGSNPGSGTNTATVTWNPNLSDGSITPGSSFQPTAPYAFGDPTTVIHDSVSVSDLITSTNPTLPATGFGVGDPVGDFPSGTLSSSHTFNYSRTLTVPHGCLTVNNTASFTVTDTDNDSDDTGSASVTAKVCRVPANTGALTMGFWQNKNGQAIITAANQANLGTWLRAFNPFSNAPSSGLAAYVATIIKNATCTSTSKTCNTMLRAQMLATALDVYFSDASLGGNRINAPAPIGAVQIDLSQVCKMIDGSGGTATCGNSFENASSEFGNPAGSCLSVLGMLQYENTADPLADAGAVWYLQVKATQVVAKDAFDAINNKVAFSCT